jgi:mono/diheme cytochrome c family protein
MIRVDVNVSRAAILLLSFICLPSAVPSDVLPDARKESVAMEGMERDAPAGHWEAPEDADKRRNPIPADGASLARGRKLFEANCASCHGAGGHGDGPAGTALSPKPSNLAIMAPQHTVGALAWKIAEGRGAMPAWKGVLNTTQIWDLVNYLQKGLTAVRDSDRHGREMKMDHKPAK